MSLTLFVKKKVNRFEIQQIILQILILPGNVKGPQTKEAYCYYCCCCRRRRRPFELVNVVWGVTYKSLVY